MDQKEGFRIYELVPSQFLGYLDIFFIFIFVFLIVFIIGVYLVLGFNIYFHLMLMLDHMMPSDARARANYERKMKD